MMNKYLWIAAGAAFISGPALADQYVRGYVKSDGTYVAPHYQTSPNGTKLDNYSTKGNVNPYTGQPGYKNPYATTPKLYQPPKQPQLYQYKPYTFDTK
jgi:hypothetical protein